MSKKSYNYIKWEKDNDNPCFYVYLVKVKCQSSWIKWLPNNCLSKYDCCSVLSACSYSLFPLWMLSGPPQQKVAAAVSIPPDSKVRCFSVSALSPASPPSSSSSSGFAAGVAVGSCETEDLGARTASNADWWVFLCSFLPFDGLQLLHLGKKRF